MILRVVPGGMDGHMITASFFFSPYEMFLVTTSNADRSILLFLSATGTATILMCESYEAFLPSVVMVSVPFFSAFVKV